MTKDATGCGKTGPDAERRDVPPGRLRWHAFSEAAVHFLVLVLFFGAVGRMFAAMPAAAGGGLACIVLAAIHGYAWRRLADNRPGDSCEIAPRLGAANRLTLLRGLLISLTAGFLFFPPEAGRPPVLAWLPGVFYLTASLMDGLDGALARRTGTDNPLGKALDGHVDALGVLVASSVAVAGGRLPAYYLAAGLAHYLYRFGLWSRRRMGKSNHPEPPRKFARTVAGFQMGFLGTALLPLFGETVLNVAAPIFLLPLLAGFVWDWLHVQGTLADRRR